MFLRFSGAKDFWGNFLKVKFPSTTKQHLEDKYRLHEYKRETLRGLRMIQMEVLNPCGLPDIKLQVILDRMVVLIKIKDDKEAFKSFLKTLDLPTWFQ